MSDSKPKSFASAVILEQARPRVSVEIERMARGPAKVSVRIDGDDSMEAARDAIAIYTHIILAVEKLDEPA